MEWHYDDGIAIPSCVHLVPALEIDEVPCEGWVLGSSSRFWVLMTQWQIPSNPPNLHSLGP